MMYMIMCQLHLLFGAQMLLCKCSCSNVSGPCSIIPFCCGKHKDETMSLGCWEGPEWWEPVTTVMCCGIQCSLLCGQIPFL